MQWFGEAWDAPINEDVKHGPTPVGLRCAGGCGVRIQPEDQGVLIPIMTSKQNADGDKHVYILENQQHIAYHLVCFLKELGVHRWES
jgi:hypothetical protein